jgi:hypothetical protein
MIGGSTPLQHWERDGDENQVKKALATGKVQVLTLSTNVRVPEPAVDWFADLAFKHNPQVRVLLQHSWGDDLTSAIMRARHDAREAGNELTLEERTALAQSAGTNAQRDAMTHEQLQAMRRSGRGIDAWREQVRELNLRHGRTTGYIVPVNEAVLRTRQAVVAGALPGVQRQSELFRDVLGHASEPTMDLVTYAWFAALYRRSPIGLRSLIAADDPAAAEHHRVLQEIAWSAVLDEPMSGVRAGPGH